MSQLNKYQKSAILFLCLFLFKLFIFQRDSAINTDMIVVCIFLAWFNFNVIISIYSFIQSVRNRTVVYSIKQLGWFWGGFLISFIIALGIGISNMTCIQC